MGDPAGLPDFVMDPTMEIGPIHLRAADLDVGRNFYKGILGLGIVNATDKSLSLGPPGQPLGLVVLSEATVGKPHLEEGGPERRSGLYHFALKLPQRRDLADFLGHLKGLGREVYFEGAADHGVSESLYIRDPDFNGIEVTWDKPSSQWRVADRSVEMFTQRLDVEGLMGAASAEGWRGFPVGTRVGHVHLHVSDLSRERNFYIDVLGLHQTYSLPGANFFAADDYHHHIAVNTWLGEGIGLPSRTAPGLDHFTLRLPKGSNGEKLWAHLRARGVVLGGMEGEEGALIQDPEGIRIKVVIVQ